MINERVELNALTSDALIAMIETKLKAYELKKACSAQSSDFASSGNLIDELIRRPSVTGRAEDGRSPEFGRAPARSDQEPQVPPC